MNRDTHMGDTDRAPLENFRREKDQRARFWRFDPTVSTGTLLQLGAIAVAVSVAYGTYREDRTQMKADIDAVKASDVRTREEMRAAFESLRSDLKELKGNVSSMSENVAVLKSQVISKQQQQ